ncbi:MAG: flagellar hook-associated protein FlgL [Aeromonas sp.]
MRISTNQIQSNMMRNMQKSYARYAELDQQIATQKRIVKPSDDAVGSVRLMGLAKEQSSIAQWQKNIENANSQLNQGEIQLDSMTNMLLRMDEITQIAANGSVTEDDRQAIASELKVLKQGMLDLANTRNENGSSLFSGSQVDKDAIVQNPDGSYAYQGDNLEREVTIANGVTVPMNQTADRLFINGGDYFKQLDDMIAAMETGDPTAQDQALAMMERNTTLQNDVSDMVSTIGARMNLLDQVKESHTEKDTYSKELSIQIGSLDFPTAISQQAQVMAALQVQQQAFVKMNDLSLFDYMR